MHSHNRVDAAILVTHVLTAQCAHPDFLIKSVSRYARSFLAAGCLEWYEAYEAFLTNLIFSADSSGIRKIRKIRKIRPWNCRGGRSNFAPIPNPLTNIVILQKFYTPCDSAHSASCHLTAIYQDP